MATEEEELRPGRQCSVGSYLIQYAWYMVRVRVRLRARLRVKVRVRVRVRVRVKVREG
jgi:hypothetical protein